MKARSDCSPVVVCTICGHRDVRGFVEAKKHCWGSCKLWRRVGWVGRSFLSCTWYTRLVIQIRRTSGSTSTYRFERLHRRCMFCLRRYLLPVELISRRSTGQEDDCCAATTGSLLMANRSDLTESRASICVVLSTRCQRVHKWHKRVCVFVKMHHYNVHKNALSCQDEV